MPEFDVKLKYGTEEELAKAQRELNWLLNNLDHLNVKRLYTEYCSIQSENGETVIDGPLITMTGSSTTVRLRAGLNNSTFEFALYNAAGAQTVGIDSSGNAQFTGEITGSVITGGTIQTSTAGRRIAIASSALSAYDSAGVKRIGLDPNVGNYYDLDFYNESGVLNATINASTNNFNIQAWDNIQLVANSIFLTADVTIGQFGGSIGFFGNSPVAKTAVADLSTSATLPQTIDKVNELLNALQGYNLV